MSAFVCSDYHIGLIAQFYFEDSSECEFDERGFPARSVSLEPAQVLADRLKARNIASVNQRYGEHDPATPCALPTGGRTMTALKALKALRCLEYQCHEGDYMESPEYLVIGNMFRSFVARLPGYSETNAWQLEPPSFKVAML